MAQIPAPKSLQEASFLLSQSESECPPLSADLAPSKLGHKSHWDEVYAREVVNFATIGDEGDVWFGEGSGEEMVEWLVENFGPELRKRIVDGASASRIQVSLRVVVLMVGLRWMVQLGAGTLISSGSSRKLGMDICRG